MKKYCIAVLFVIILASCGGNKADREGISVNLGLDWPEELAALDTSSYKLKGLLSNDDTIIADDVDAEYFEGRYYFDFGWITPGRYTFSVSFEYIPDDSPVLVARASRSVEFVDGEIQLIFDKADFTDIGGGDPDGDTLSSLTELVLGLDPFLGDSDGDDFSDGIDIFPSLVSEWLDTDGDGLGDNSDDDIDGDGLDNDTELNLGTDVTKADTDGDSIGDASDNCKLKPNKDQIDTDSDGHGNKCDDDSDGDGLTDEQEIQIGTDPLVTDTDGDGLSDRIESDSGLNPLVTDTDGDRYGDKDDVFPKDPSEWQDTDYDGIGDNADNCPRVPNKDQVNTDQRLAMEGLPAVSDACGDACEDECDNDMDGDGLNFVYVDISDGSDDNAGVFAEPVKSIKAGMLLAYQRGEAAVIVAGGEYDLNDTVFKRGINLLGGYDGRTFYNHSNYRKMKDTDRFVKTYLYNSESPVTLNLGPEVGAATIQGFYIENTVSSDQSSVVILKNTTVILSENIIILNDNARFSKGVEVIGGTPRIDANRIERTGSVPGRESKGIFVESADPVITNNIIRAGVSLHTVAIEISDSNAVIVNNTLDGTSYADSPGTAAGLVFRNSNPFTVNNIIIASSRSGCDSIAMKCFGTVPNTAKFFNNILSTFSSGTSDALVADCSREYYYTAEFEMGLSEVSGNIAFDGSFEELLDADYGLTDSTVGVGQGIDANTAELGGVERDYDANRRAPGSYDIGAKERP